MNYSEAFNKMLDSGAKIKLPEWDGYWEYVNTRSTKWIVAHHDDGSTSYIIRESIDTVARAFGFIDRDDWEDASGSNCKLLKNKLIQEISIPSQSFDVASDCIRTYPNAGMRLPSWPEDILITIGEDGEVHYGNGNPISYNDLIYTLITVGMSSNDWIVIFNAPEYYNILAGIND